MVFLLIAGADCSSIARGGSQPRSLALKDSVQVWHGVYPFHRDESAHDLWNVFMLVQRANAGEAIAQHELGIRYLLGDGFNADTLKAAVWVQKAAAQNVFPAKYNFGILLNNGWGVPWDPFEAYRQFQYAASRGMAESQYVVGLLLTDNLVVPRNYAKAYRMIKKAADSGYEPAQQALQEFRRRRLDRSIDSSSDFASRTADSAVTAQSPQGSSTLQPSYLDLDNTSAPEIDDEILLSDVVRQGVITSGTAERVDSIGGATDHAALDSVRDAAEAGSPEALTLLGRWYEGSRNLRRDRILATVCYLRAVHLDGPWATILLSTLLLQEGYFSELHRRVDEGDANALFAWAELVALDFDHQITQEQALTFLRHAAGQDSPPALVVLGLNYYNGHWVETRKDEARRLFKQAAAAGSSEGRLRLTMMLLGEPHDSVKHDELFSLLISAARKGSVLAQGMVGYCYERGVGVRASIPEAVRFYREAAERGNRTAYHALRMLYDARRPKDPEFQIPY